MLIFLKCKIRSFVTDFVNDSTFWTRVQATLEDRLGKENIAIAKAELFSLLINKCKDLVITDRLKIMLSEVMTIALEFRMGLIRRASTQYILSVAHH